MILATVLVVVRRHYLPLTTPPSLAPCGLDAVTREEASPIEELELGLPEGAEVARAQCLTLRYTGNGLYRYP